MKKHKLRKNPDFGPPSGWGWFVAGVLLNGAITWAAAALAVRVLRAYRASTPALPPAATPPALPSA